MARTSIGHPVWTSIGHPFAHRVDVQWTSVKGPLDVYWTSRNGRPLNVYWTSTGCSSDIHWTSKIGCPLDVYWTSTGRLLTVQQVPRPKYIQKTSTGRPLDVYHGCPPDVHWMSARGLWDVQWTSVMDVQWMSNGHQPRVHGTSCGRPL